MNFSIKQIKTFMWNYHDNRLDVVLKPSLNTCSQEELEEEDFRREGWDELYSFRDFCTKCRNDIRNIIPHTTERVACKIWKEQFHQYILPCLKYEEHRKLVDEIIQSIF